MFWKKTFFERSLFIRLMASFLLVIIIVSSFFVIAFSLYINNLQNQLVNNIQERFEITWNKFDYEFEKVTDALYRLSTDDYFKPVLSNKKITYYDMFQLKNLMTRSVSLNEGINTMFLLSANSDLIISTLGTFNKNDFFDKYFQNPYYNLEFWDRERQSKFYYTVYNPGNFTDLTNPKIASQHLLPVAFKQKSNPGFILVAFVNIDIISAGMDKSFLQNFIILNQNKVPVYSTLEPGGKVEKLAVEGAARSGEGYFLNHDSRINGVVYRRFITNLELRKTLFRTNAVIGIILLVSILISLALSYFISRNTNNLAKKIVEILGSPAGGDAQAASSNTDLQHIRKNIQSIIAQNSWYSKEIKTRDLILEDFFYRTKIKNIHVQFDGDADRFAIRNNYILICFTLHYKEFHFEKTGFDLSKGTFRIKELLSQSIKEYFRNCITFQTENNQIVSILNVESRTSDIGMTDAIEEMLASLRDAEPFVFFTVAVSDVKSDILELDTVYNSMLALSKNRKLEERNQILAESDKGRQDGKFYFSLAQEEHFSEYLSNGRLNECIQQADEILEYNRKNEVDNFQFQLLCTEIISCSVKVLGNLNKDLPKELNIYGAYGQLAQCWNIEQFKVICKNFIMAAAERINTFEKSKEYIVGYIKEYVENHYAEDIYLDLLAEKLHLSKVYISLHFKNKTGINFSDWLNDFRMKKAVDMLNNTTMKVQDIARSTGYNTNTFIRIYKKYSGKTPSEYRQAHMLDQ